MPEPGTSTGSGFGVSGSGPVSREISAADLLDLAANPDKYKALLAEIQSQQAELDKRIAAVGDIDSIAALKRRIEADQALAATAASIAQADAGNLRDQAGRALAEAKAQAAQTLADAQAQADRTLADARIKADDANGRQIAATAREQALDARDAALRSRELDAEAKMQAAKDMQAEATRRTEAMKAALGQ